MYSESYVPIGVFYRSNSKMEPKKKPRTLQELHNEKIKEICENYHDSFESCRTEEGVEKARVDFLKAIASNLGIRPTPKAILHSKKPGKKAKKSQVQEDEAK